jgi:thiamine pyrophosphate-dependent acetolactate synthase large subunit-like protein
MVSLGDRLQYLGQEILVHELGGENYPAHLAIVADAHQRIAELEEMLRRTLADEWTVLHEDIEDAISAILAKKA